MKEDYKITRDKIDYILSLKNELANLYQNYDSIRESPDGTKENLYLIFKKDLIKLDDLKNKLNLPQRQIYGFFNNSGIFKDKQSLLPVIFEITFYLEYMEGHLEEDNNVKIDDKFIFIITPFDIDFQDSTREIKRACEKFTFTAETVDKIAGNCVVTDEIYNCINKARYVIANLSELNSDVNGNVYLELGYAIKSRGIENIIVVAKNTFKNPFDVSGINQVRYKNMTELENNLTARFNIIFNKK